MPYRPIQHQLSAMAVAKVCGIWTSIGAAVEEIQQDYGEDLLVQTCLNGKMDASRIWVQVKGVQRAPRMKNPGGKAQIRVRADQALRWARSADIVVLVLWDVENNVGWYSMPGLSNLHAELIAKDRQNIQLTVHSDNLFDTNAARDVAWVARQEHLAKFVRDMRVSEIETQDEPDDGRWAHEAIVEATVDMMIDLGILKKVPGEKLDKGRVIVITQAFHELFLAEAGKRVPGNADEIDDFLMEAALVSLLSWGGNITKVGISQPLIPEMLMVLENALRFSTLRERLREFF
jgi:Domain of unknown function (DUF4365)